MSGITITIRVNGKDLPEYPTSNDLTKLQNKRLQRHMKKVTTTHYIEVEDGDTFEVFISVEPPYRMDCPILGFRVFVDGDWIQEPTLSRQAYEEDGKWSAIVTGPAVEVDGKLAYRPMIFKPLAVSKLITISRKIRKLIIPRPNSCCQKPSSLSMSRKCNRSER
jgi:hypothetical protein